jgi:Zn-dependent M28 family amino/carboxypeptidase
MTVSAAMHPARDAGRGRDRTRSGRLIGVAVALVGVAAVLRSAGAAAPPRFDSAAAFRHLEHLVAIGPRVAGSPAASRTRDYIVAQLRHAGVETRVQAFEADTPHGRLKMANVLGVVPGRRADVIMIAGHYDTKWFADFRFVGANDGGSSTALLLELARVLARSPREFTYWIAFFDGEEARVTWSASDSLYGSRHMARELQRTGRLPRALIVADMIGDRDLDIRREQSSTSWLTDLLWDAARRLRYRTHFLDEALAVEDDHAPFLRVGVPSALLIDFDYPPWHTAADTLDRVSAESLGIVGEVLLETLPDIEQRLATERGRSTPPGAPTPAPREGGPRP